MKVIYDIDLFIFIIGYFCYFSYNCCIFKNWNYIYKMFYDN